MVAPHSQDQVARRVPTWQIRCDFMTLMLWDPIAPRGSVCTWHVPRWAAQLYVVCRQAAAERATSLRRTRDQANHRLEELKGHIKVQCATTLVLLTVHEVVRCVKLVMFSPQHLVANLLTRVCLH